MGNPPVYTLTEMKEKYGSFFESGAQLTLDQSHIPQKLWPLVPYAAFWGFEDDRAREKLVLSAPKSVKKNLKAAVGAFERLLLDWLGGAESTAPNPTLDYCAFSVLVMAADFIIPADLM
jgi:hypothetical protein